MSGKTKNVPKIALLPSANDDVYIAFRYEGPGWDGLLGFMRNVRHDYSDELALSPDFIPEYIRVKSISIVEKPSGSVMVINGTMRIHDLIPTRIPSPVSRDGQFLQFWEKRPIHAPEDPGQEIGTHPDEGAYHDESQSQ